MMVLLEEKSLTPRTKFQPEKLSLTLTERTSTATMTVSEDAPEMTVGDWMKMEDGPGAGIVWRIKSIDDQYDRATKTVNLEHIINTLRDRIIIDEVKSEYISGAAGVWPTNGDTARFILENWQSTWRLGGVADGDVRNPYSFNGDDLFSALETVSGTIEDCFWQYDMSSYPFRIDLVYLSPSVVSEMRTDRNIRTLKKTIDRTGMYTRIFPIGKDDLRIPGGSISMNTEIYGAIHKTETDESKETADELYWWAYEKLRKHCYPTVTISISGLDLAEATGETLDKLRVGYMCRVPLPEYNTTITERVTKLSYSDVINDPMNVTVTLSNKQEDVATISSVINSLTSAMGGGGRTSAANSGKDHAWIEDTEEHVALVAEGIIGTDENGEPNWKRLSQIVVDGEGLHQTVEEIKEGDVIRDARIDVNEKRILQEVTDRTNADGELQGRITVQADRITQEVTQRKGDTEALSGRITVEAGRISQIVSAVGKDGEVTAASITLAINEGKSGAWIDADNVWIGNDKSTTVIAGKLEASDITAQFLSARISQIVLLQANALSVAGGINGSGTLTIANLATFNGSIRLGSGNSFNKCIVSASVTGSTLKLTDSGGDVVNFNKAVTLSGAWSGTTYGVSATSGTISGTAPSTSVYLAIEGAANPNATVNAKIYKDNPSVSTNQLTNVAMTLAEDVTNKKVTLSANSLTKGSISTVATYNAGWNYGLTTRVMSGEDAGSAQAIKTLDYGQKWRVRVTLKNSSGADVTSDYVVQSKDDGYDEDHSPCIGGSQGSASNPDKKTSVSISPNGSVDLWPYLKKRDGSWTWGDQCTVSANGTAFNHPSGPGACTLYYRLNGDYYSAGTHTWYYT